MRLFDFSCRGVSAAMFLLRRRVKFFCNSARFLSAMIVAASVLCASNAPAQTVNITVNSAQQVKTISPYIYGANSTAITNATSQRLGGNRWTAYNWENNNSNAGNDYIFQNDSYLSSSTTPGAAITPTLTSAVTKNQAVIITVPTNGYVSKDRQGNGDVRYPNGDTSQQKLDQQTIWSTRFVPEVLYKPGGPASLTRMPSTSDSAVYVDEFVNWAKTNPANAQPKQIFYSLDNEPDLWNGTHAEVHPSAPTYAEMVQKSTDYSKAIKSVDPNAVVFGAVNYGWAGYTQLQGATSDPSIKSTILNFQASYLKQMKTASDAAGKRLVDVLDMHWYPEAHGTNGIRIINNDTSAATIAARVQAPRSLWDPTYIESSWITQDSLPFQPSATPAQFKTNAIQLLPREQALIDQYNPGTKIGITEYNYGAGQHISGGVAEADALGVFGQQSVYAANWWPDGSNASYVNSAFNMYLNYDGKGGKFGNTSIQATNSNLATASVFASQDAGNPNRVVMVLINKTDSTVPANINLNVGQTLSLADAYQMTGSSATIAHIVNSATPQWQFSGANALTYSMPAMSVTTLSLVKAQLGDLNVDGLVTNSDVQAMLSALANVSSYKMLHNLSDPQLLSLGDFNSDGLFTAADLRPFLQSLANGGTVQGVPEPSSVALAALGLFALVAKVSATRTRKRPGSTSISTGSIPPGSPSI
jgi:hypothetical protein